MILHIDMDAFFAAVEQRDNPDLRNKAIIVAGHSKRSVVATASYEARRFGIHSAMPVFKAKQLCSNLIIVQGNRHKYSEASKRIMDVITSFSPLVEQVSIDEAYVDIRGCEKLFGSPMAMAQKIKTAIFNTVFLTCSIGIAPVKFLAKIASDMDKPSGVTLISQEKMEKVIADLPISKVPGVGKQAMKQMERLQIQTLGDIGRFDIELLNQKFGKMGSRLFELAQGKDNSQVETKYSRKSISSETTLSKDISKFQDAKQILLALSQRVGRDLRKKKMVCRSISIKIKFSDFTQITRSKKIDSWICSSAEIFKEAIALYGKIVLKKKIRLLGVGVSHFMDKNTPVQMELLSPPGEKEKKQWESVDTAVDSIMEKFGSDIVSKASLSISKQGGKKMSISCIKVVITGRVQGVFFRANTQKQALRLNLTGYVKNLADGSVEALFQGDNKAVKKIEDWCRTGPAASRVDHIRVHPADLTETYTAFGINYD
jgi:DNA polymerase-4